MTQTGIACFLAICRYKTITRAAETLYITQSSLSMRLRNLETELGGALFFRKKGSREMTLTAAGKEFYELAVQYTALEQEMTRVCKKQPRSFRIAFFNSLGTYLLPEVVELFLQEHPQLHLELQDMDLDAAEKSLQSGATDLCFTAGKTTDEHLRQRPVFREPMVLLCGKAMNLTAPVSAHALPGNREICVDWSSSFTHWHREIFPRAEPQITISIMTHLQQFLSSGTSWSIVPVSVAEGLLKTGNLQILETDFALPCREISILTAPELPESTVDSFCDCLGEILATHPAIESLM